MSSLMDKFKGLFENSSKSPTQPELLPEKLSIQDEKILQGGTLKSIIDRAYDDHLKESNYVSGKIDIERLNKNIERLQKLILSNPLTIDGEKYSGTDLKKLFNPTETAQAHNEKLLLAELGSPEEVKRVCDALFSAIKKGDMAGVASVLDAHPSAIGARYQERSNWKELFYVALESSTPEVCRALIEKYGVDPEARLNDRATGATPLCYMIGQCSDINRGYEKIDLLIEGITKKSGAAGLNVLSQGCPALHKAIRFSSFGAGTRIVKRLIDAGASLDVPLSDFDYIAWMRDEKNQQRCPGVCAVIQEALVKKAEVVCSQGTSEKVRRLGKMQLHIQKRGGGA